ncbi:DUF3519 domain-containing protein, partial [Helicobacter pylori]|uniref:DUF3519 domain-containing protein n=1 Tax=Helicobacter pylori TaxID=210 RepID=UPI003570B640
QEDLLKTSKDLNETTQEAKNLSTLEQANAEKLAKLESEKLESEKEFTRLKEQEKERKAALKKKLEHERGNAGNIESATKIEVGEDIPTQMQAQIPKSRVRLNEREIYDLDYAIVKAKDLKPSFTTGGTQKRTDMNEEQIKSIAQNFDPKKIFGSGGFEDIPIILNDGQVIAGNHRIQGMLNFTPKSRFAYERAIKEYYHIDLKPDELLVRLPSKRLNNTEINNLAASSNQGRFNSESDHAIAVLSHYEAKLKELETQLNADSVYSLKNIVAKNLNFDKATHPNVGDSNLALLMFNMPRTKTQGIELLNRWHKVFSNDSKSYEKVKKMFVDNAGSFHNLIHDMNFPKVSLNAYLSNIMDRSFANLKNYVSTSESLKDLSEKFYKTSSLEMFEKSDQSASDISEILGGAIARFARFDDPSKALFEALRSDNIKKGLKEFKIADVTKDMFDPNSKEFKDIDIYDFTHYLLMVGREPNENNAHLNRLIQAVKDRQKESEKGIKGQKLKTPSEWGNNYSEFKGDGLGAINKLLETKKGFVAGAFHKEGLGDIDLVWGNKDYGLEHILKKREKQYTRLGLNAEQIKERTDELLKSIPEVIEKGVLFKDDLGRVSVELNNIRVGLKNTWDDNNLNNHFMVTSYERDKKVLRELETNPPLSNDYKGNSNYSALNLNEDNPTKERLTSQEDLLKTQENPQKTQDLSPLELANAEKLAKLEREQEQSEQEFLKAKEQELKRKEALEKLLQEKNGQVAGAAFRDDLGGIDFVWGTPKTKDSSGYGLAHVLERREQQALADGLSEAEAKEYALNIVKSIPEVLEKGTKGTDHLGRVFVDYGNKRVGLNNTWNNKDLENHWVISSYELRDTTEKPTHFPTSQAITKEKDIHSLNSVEPNPTQKPLTDQEDLLKNTELDNETTKEATKLSPLEQANAEKLAKLESEKLESEKEFTRLKEQEQARKAALKKKLEHERGNAGNIESATKIEVGEDIPTQALTQIPKSRVRLNEREIYDLDYAIVKAKDLKPSFTTGGTQKRTDMNEEQIKSIAQNFDPKKIFGSGGFEDLPIILHDGQVIAGNHRVQGMLNFTPKSRFAYERAIKEYYHIDLKPDELLVRLPSKRLNNTEINNLAASSNQGRFNSESDHAIAVLSHYEAKLKELETQLNADSVYSLKNIVAKNLNFDKATHPNVGDSNLALLMFNMPRTKTQGIELLNRWHKVFSNDSKSYEKVKKMFVDNAGSFHNLIHDMNFPKVSLNAYLSNIMDRSFANLKNYVSTSESLKDLSEKFYKTSSLEMFEKSDQSASDISEILGGAIARFARFDDPSKALFEALRSDNIKKGLKEFKIADVTKDMFDPNSKEFKDIDIYDFTHYLLMVGREPNENNAHLNRLIQAVKDRQKESEKGIKEA